VWILDSSQVSQDGLHGRHRGSIRPCPADGIPARIILELAGGRCGEPWERTTVALHACRITVNLGGSVIVEKVAL